MSYEQRQLKDQAREMVMEMVESGEITRDQMYAALDRVYTWLVRVEDEAKVRGL